MKNILVTTFTIFLGLIFPQSALAYLDPGAGSFMLQMLIAGIMGAMFTIKMYWYRLKQLINEFLGRESTDPQESPPVDSDEES
jgi:hypothetical protein